MQNTTWHKSSSCSCISHITLYHYHMFYIHNITWSNYWHQTGPTVATTFILMGDFNSHNIMDIQRNKQKWLNLGKKIINENNLCLLNTGMQTYINPFSGNASAIDLTICDPSIYLSIWISLGKCMMILVAAITFQFSWIT